ncbi:calcineurin-like phosphoesterase family protein [Prauserella shujinwangii]|uniref:Calcineurin-like phosphoesterase family protein n=1 Tax=Prauserella shujinwangii TaxID=1453103 RepID=A0A2T0M2H7_9PSEU|nr:metallophosphoesterase family protein [Prauserella shujinwangii]PRX50944.1 calcineurin-like phosphoesterase family protein [Prauserella shujinwangii]
MTRPRLAALAAAVLLPLTTLPLTTAPATAVPDGTSPSRAPLTLAVLGDTPYGAEQVEDFPNLVRAVNRAAGVRQVLHLGDIKNGGSVCDDAYFQRIAGDFERFLDPVLYTPGDNEWTDCHRASNGGYDPLERLDALRSVFFAEPGSALGVRPMRVATQAGDPAHETFVENVRWTAADTVFATVHAVGSHNGLAPWFGDAETPGQRERREAEVRARTAAALAWIDAAFDTARSAGARGVVLAMQADTFIGGGGTGFTAIVRRIADRSRAFPGEVLLLQGDSHRFAVDRPLREGHAGYGITEPVPNLTRLVVEGETTAEWLRLTVDPTARDLFRWERVTRN